MAISSAGDRGPGRLPRSHIIGGERQKEDAG
jgi:hypothetical protein